MISDFRDIIDSWASMTELAGDLGEKHGTVRKWRQRNFIPPRKWRALIVAARGRKISITESDLVRIADDRQSAA